MKRIKNSPIARKAALVLGLSFFLQAMAMPAVDNDFFTVGDARADMSYVLDILKENKTGLSSMEELKLAEVIFEESTNHNLDPFFVLALIKTESNFYNWSKSLNGAIGLMQILPFTGKALAGEMNLKWRGEATLLDPFTNVKMGIHYFSSLNERFNDMNASIAAYNAGPTYFASRTRRGCDKVAANYVDKVLDNYKDLRDRADYY